MILIDTNICIYIIKGVNHVREQAKCYDLTDIYISSISVAEMMFGAAKSTKPAETRAKMYHYINRINVLDFGIKDTLAYGEIRATLSKRGDLIGSLDMLIAAQALANGCKLVTNNTREFERVSGLVLENWVR
jgi:tRNA(fMet)-specific endonuclease VapC